MKRHLTMGWVNSLYPRALSNLSTKAVPLAMLAIALLLPGFCSAQGPTPAIASPGAGPGAITASHFEVLSGAQSLGMFSSVVGLSAQNGPIMQGKPVMGGPQGAPLNRPVGSSSVTFERSGAGPQSLFLQEWRQAIIDGKLIRRDLVIVGYGANGTPAVRFLLSGALPEKLSAPALSAGATAGVYSVTFTYLKIQRQQ